MSVLDISRYLNQPEKQYSGLVRQQGAVITDSDENERDLIQQQNLRGVLADAIGANGTPNDGFKVTAVTDEGGKFDLTLAAGTFFIGGVRYEAPTDFTLEEQINWLQFESMHGLPTVPEVEQYHLVWLEAWEQTVSAREDSELLEAALNGVDTSGRTRRMSRVHVTPTERESCRDAFGDLIEALEAQGAHFETDTGRLTGTTRLQVTSNEGGAADDLCSPRSEGGYLGADNETIRVQIIEPGRLIWGLSNASPVYRVKARTVNGQRRELRMLTLPWDQVAQPKVGDVVEIIRWGAQLPNKEKIAEPTGIFTRVSRSWQRSDGTLLVEGVTDDGEDVLEAWHNWLTGDGAEFQSSRDPEDAETYLYMRVWRGAVFDEGSAGIDFSVGEDIELERTGLSIRLNANGRPGDYWIFSVRPNTPHEIMPWTFQKAGGELPTGPVRYLSVLAHLDWTNVGEDNTFPKIDDCRRRFRPLSHASSCCEITVGDGVNSHGDVSSIQQAVDMLPTSGGKICVLKGDFEEAFAIEGRENVMIEGCGALTKITLPTNVDHTLVGLTNCRNITLRSMTLVAPHDMAVTVTGDHLEPDTNIPRSQDIALEHLIIHARDAAAVFASPVQSFRLTDSRVVFASKPEGNIAEEIVAPGQMPGVVIGGNNIKILDCHISSSETELPKRPFGGIHVIGGSQNIHIKRNVIRQIGGYGVALGSWAFVAIEDDSEPQLAEIGVMARSKQPYNKKFNSEEGSLYAADQLIRVNENGCHQAAPEPIPPNDGEDEQAFDVDVGSPVELIQIADNEIFDTGLSGIGVIRFFDLGEYQAVIAVRDIEIRNNKIIRSAQFELPELSGSRALHRGSGGITLGVVDSGTILENVISEAGGNDLDPYCGIFILKANGLAIERNTITENGGELYGRGPVKLGQRGGVVIGMASAPQIDVAAGLPARTIPSGVPALRFHDNVVIQPNGRALQCLAEGPLSVCNNHLVARGGILMAAQLRDLVGSLLDINRETEVDLDEAILRDLLPAILEVLGGLCVSLVCIPNSTADSDKDTGTTSLLNGSLSFRREIMLHDNQILYEPSATSVGYSWTSSVLVLGGVVSVCNNQCQANLLPNDQFGLAQLFAAAYGSVRVANNYVRQQGFSRDSRLSPISIGSFGLINTTSMNHYSGGLETLSLLGLAETDNLPLEP